MKDRIHLVASRISRKAYQDQHQDQLLAQWQWQVGDFKFHTEKEQGVWYIVKTGTDNRFPMTPYNIKRLENQKEPDGNTQEMPVQTYTRPTR